MERVTALSLGKGVETSNTQGPLVNAAVVKKVQQDIDDAVSKGASVRTGGKPPADARGIFL
jgi:succinate-semialdehyde dehydrogenase/glutarate-semialdehyde dehydrogenase